MKTHKIITRRRGISIVEVTVALAIIMIVSAATTTLLLRVSEAEGEVAHTMAHNERIENVIECYQWANGNPDDFADAMEELGYQDLTLNAPTCTTAGSMACTCPECDDSYTIDIDPIRHTYGSVVVTPPTCEEQGYATYTCTNIDPTTGNPCGDFYTVEIAPIEHKYDDVVETPPTCEEQGYTTYTCTNIDPTTNELCGHSYDDNYVDALGHADENKDHVCDNGCEVYQGTHADAADDSNHVCDYGCGAVLEECTDNDNDQKCDVCGAAKEPVEPGEGEE